MAEIHLFHQKYGGFWHLNLIFDHFGGRKSVFWPKIDFSQIFYPKIVPKRFFRSKNVYCIRNNFGNTIFGQKSNFLTPLDGENNMWVVGNYQTWDKNDVFLPKQWFWNTFGVKNWRKIDFWSKTRFSTPETVKNEVQVLETVIFLTEKVFFGQKKSFYVELRVTNSKKVGFLPKNRFLTLATKFTSV